MASNIGRADGRDEAAGSEAAARTGACPSNERRESPRAIGSTVPGTTDAGRAGTVTGGGATAGGEPHPEATKERTTPPGINDRRILIAFPPRP